MAKKKRGFFGKLIRLFFFLFLLVALAAGALAAAIYFEVVDAEELNEQFGLYKLPVVGEYFVKPLGADDTGDEDTNKKTEETPAPTPENVTPTQPVAGSPKTPEPEKKESKPVKVSQEDIEKERKAQEAAEKKRISKLARLYDQMKPQEAAEAMNSLSDDVAVAILKRMDESQAAKVMAAFEADKAASITQIMYDGP